jgi:hypothetical protein
MMEFELKNEIHERPAAFVFWLEKSSTSDLIFLKVEARDGQGRIGDEATVLSIGSHTGIMLHSPNELRSRTIASIGFDCGLPFKANVEIPIDYDCV